MMEELIGIKEAAKRLNVTKHTLRVWDNEKKLLAVKTIGGHRKYRISDIEKIVNS